MYGNPTHKYEILKTPPYFSLHRRRVVELSGDSTSRPIPPTRGIKRPTRGTLKKYVVGAKSAD